MTNTFVHRLVDFDDLAVLLPLIAVMTAWLAAFRKRQLLAWWALAVVLVMGSTAVLKVYFYVCPPLPDLRSPSGGAGLSTFVYGALTLVTASALSRWQSFMMTVAGTAFVAAIVFSIVIGDVHTVHEAALGTAIGLGALGLFARSYLQERRPSPQFAIAMAAVCLALMLLLHGHDFSTEMFLHDLALSLHTGPLKCN